MRRRHIASEQMSQPDDDRDALQEPLIARDDEEHKVHTRVGQQIIIWQPFDLSSFVVSILMRCANAFNACWKVVETSCILCLSTLGGPRLQTLSLVQEERLEQLWVALSQPFSLQDEGHQQHLRDLWAYAFPDDPCTSLKSEQWKDMGWQGDDPSTDIRGAGLYGVQNLLYFARCHPAEFERLLHKRSGVRADWEYPFAAAGMNLTFALAELLGIKRGIAGAAAQDKSVSMPLDRMQKQPAFQGFVALLSIEPYSFEELYVVAFRLLDDRWLQSKASYMQFNAVMKECMAELTKALRLRPANFQQLTVSLGL